MKSKWSQNKKADYRFESAPSSTDFSSSLDNLKSDVVASTETSVNVNCCLLPFNTNKSIQDLSVCDYHHHRQRVQSRKF